MSMLKKLYEELVHGKNDKKLILMKQLFDFISLSHKPCAKHFSIAFRVLIKKHLTFYITGRVEGRHIFYLSNFAFKHFLE